MAGIVAVTFRHSHNLSNKACIFLTTDKTRDLPVSRNASLRNFFNDGKDFVNQVLVQDSLHFISLPQN